MSNIFNFSKVAGVPLESICRELIPYSWHNPPTERQFPEHHAILHSLLVELLTELEIPIVAFPKATFNTSTVRDAWAPYTSGTRGVAMIGFGSRRVPKRCMVR